MEPADTFDISRARAETPGCAHVLHLNNAGAALMPAPVLQAVRDYWSLEERIGGYEAAEHEASRLAGVYTSVGRLLNCAPHEVALTDSATRAWASAFYAFDFQPGDRILTARAEYASNFIAYLQAARRTGVEVVPIPSDSEGQLDVAALEAAIDPRVRLIAITHVPTNGGLVNPAAAVGRLARAAGVPFLLDACQSAGQLPLDVEKLGCDMLSATGRKYLRGPRGTGFLYVREALSQRLEPPMLDLHAATWTGPNAYTVREDARRFEMWEANYADRVGLGAAVDYALSWGLPAIESRVKALAAGLRAQLSELPGVTVHDLGPERCGIVTFSSTAREAATLKVGLSAQAINVTVASPSGALLDAQARGLPNMVRASVHYYNDLPELERFLATLRTLLN